MLSLSKRVWIVVGAAACAIALEPATADLIVTYTDRPTFEAAAGVPLTIEDFTHTSHFPISSGVLNSETYEPDANHPLGPGDIQPGVTYSTPIGKGNFFNIDSSAGYDGGFLDGFHPTDREVTVEFHQTDPGVARTVWAFGFDIGTLGAGDFDVLIQFDSGSSKLFNFTYPNSLSFFGFVSNAQDIESVVIGNNRGNFGFAFDFDNFTYDAACPWNLDDDDTVGAADLIVLLGSWGDPYGTADLIELLGNWGPCP